MNSMIEKNIWEFVEYLANKSQAENIIFITSENKNYLDILRDYNIHILVDEDNSKYYQDLGFETFDISKSLATEIIEKSIVFIYNLDENIYDSDSFSKSLSLYNENSPYVLFSIENQIKSLNKEFNLELPVTNYYLDFYNFLNNIGIYPPFIGYKSDNFNPNQNTFLTIFGREANLKKVNKVSCLAIIFTFNESDIILETVDHLLNQGLDIFLSDNWSTDNTYEILTDKYKNNSRVFLSRFPKEKTIDNQFHLHDILEEAEKIAKNSNYDWIMHYDSDELRYSPWNNVSLIDAISWVDYLGYNVIDFTVIDFRYTDDTVYTGKYEDSLRNFEFGRREDLFLQEKSWKNNQNLSLSESGGHNCEFPSKKTFPLKFLMKHYPLRNEEHAMKKIFKERIPRFKLENEKYGWHSHYNNHTKEQVKKWKDYNLIAFDNRFNQQYLIERLSGIGIIRDDSSYVDECRRFKDKCIELETECTGLETECNRFKELNLQLEELNTIAENSISNLENNQRVLKKAIKNKNKRIKSQNKRIKSQNKKIKSQNKSIKNQKLLLKRFKSSKSWKITKPMRNIGKLFRKIKNNHLLLIFSRNKLNLRKVREDINIYNDVNKSNFIDKKFYLKRYPGVKRACMDPVIHYMYHGEKEGKYPNKNEMIFSNINKKRDDSKMDIIFFSIIPYNYGYHQRPQHIADYLAKNGHQVHYINPDFSKSDIRIETINKNIQMINFPSKNKHVSKEFSSESLNDLKKEMDRYIAKVGITDFYVFSEFPYWGALLKHLKEKYNSKIIFDILDEFSGFHPDDEYLSKLLDDSINVSDLLITTSDYLYKKVLSFNKKTKLIRNGTEFEHFNSYYTSEKSKNEKAPIIGYYGALSHWFDFDKIEYLAKNRPEYDIVLIGNVGDSKKELRENVEKLDNVKFLGQKDYKDLPKYLKKFDVALIPFKHDLDLIKATNPVKFYEYLSMGKKIVATKIPELFDFEGEFVYLANDNNDFLQYVDQCVNGKDTLSSDEEKIAFAKIHDWSSRVSEIEESILNLYDKVSIIIVTYNNLDYTKKCLNSIFQMTAYPNYEILIVDNFSNDGTREYLSDLDKKCDNVRIFLNTENLGFSRANNIGLREAKGKYLILLNNDTIVTSGWISGFIKHLSKYGLVGPVTNSIGNEAKIDIDYDSIDQIEKFSKKHRNEHLNEIYPNIPVLAMFCLAMDKKTFEDIGELDESFELGMFEDDDYAHRARLKGYEIVCAEDIFIHHFGGASFSKLETKEYKQLFEKNKSLFENKWNIKWIPHKYREE